MSQLPVHDYFATEPEVKKKPGTEAPYLDDESSDRDVLDL
jgi:hypothetical protein